MQFYALSLTFVDRFLQSWIPGLPKILCGFHHAFAFGARFSWGEAAKSAEEVPPVAADVSDEPTKGEPAVIASDSPSWQELFGEDEACDVPIAPAPPPSESSPVPDDHVVSKPPPCKRKFTTLVWADPFRIEKKAASGRLCVLLPG